MKHKLLICSLLTSLAILSSAAQAQIFPPLTVFKGDTGTLELPHLVFDGRLYYLRLSMIDPVALTLQVDEATLVDVTPADGSTDGKTAQDIVGNWIIEGEDTEFTFNADGTWSMTQPAGADEEACPDGGIESGTFRYIAVTGVFIPTFLVDENGSCGLSHSTDTVLRMLPDGNTMTVRFGNGTEVATLTLKE